MATNNFKLFDQNKANLLSDTEYENSTQRLNGVQTGVASSQLNNKFAYQVSLVAYAIAQIMNQNGLDASDTLAVSAFVGNLGGSLMQKVADRASTAEAVAGVLANKYISPATMKAAALLLSGGTMSGTLNMNSNRIINLPTPSANSEPATKGYVDGVKSGLEESISSVNNFTVKKEIVEDFTYDYTLSNYKNGPKILVNKNLFKTLWLIQTVTISGTIQATYTRSQTVNFGLPIYLEQLKSFGIVVSNNITRTFNNDTYKCFSSISELNSSFLVPGSSISRTLTQFGEDVGKNGIYILVNNDYICPGYDFFNSSEDYIQYNLNIHYKLERYYFE